MQTKQKWFIQDIHKTDHYLMYSEILYIESRNREITVITLKERFRILKTFKDLQKELPHEFLRIHRSIIINLTYLTKVYRYEVAMSDGNVFPIPEKRYKDLRLLIQQYHRH